MSGIKYYQLRNGEELPDEFCAVRDVNGEPSKYTWYERTGELERDQLKAENARLRELVAELYPLADYGAMSASELDKAHDLMRELGIEVDDA